MRGCRVVADNGPAVTDTITIDASGCAVVDVSVDVIITHTWISDLEINITGPAGLTTSLWDGVCTSSDNIDVTFVDGGTSTLCADVSAPGIGEVDPLTPGFGPPLAQFSGTFASGDWILSVRDTFGGDTGTLDFWAVDIDCGIGECLSPAYTCGGFDVFETEPGVFVSGFAGNLVVGTNQSDNLFGTNGPDLILGLGGSDEISGGGGDDVICGGSGGDGIHGDGGDDTIFGQGGQGADVETSCEQ